MQSLRTKIIPSKKRKKKEKKKKYFSSINKSETTKLN